MKILSKIAILFVLSSGIMVNAQVLSGGGAWDQIGQSSLTIVYTDADNTDGAGDGAFKIGSATNVPGQGVYYTFSGEMINGEQLDINTYTYGVSWAKVEFFIELYNVTDQRSLVVSDVIEYWQTTLAPKLTDLSYNATLDDDGDVLQVRYVRVDDGYLGRQFVIDNISLNGRFVPMTSICSSEPPAPDLSLVSSTPDINKEIDLVMERMKDIYFGSSPSVSWMETADQTYDDLQITVNNGVISGKPVTDWGDIPSSYNFLRAYGARLRFNPNDGVTKEKLNNTIWWLCKQFCEGTLKFDPIYYSFGEFALYVTMSKEFVTSENQERFKGVFYEQTLHLHHFWASVYEEEYQEVNGAINSDMVYNLIESMLAFADWQGDADRRYQYMRGFKRYVDRFGSYTFGETDGLKPDGSGFHHYNSYDHYMFAYKYLSNSIYYCRGTSFQPEVDSYLRIRDANMKKLVVSNDNGMKALSMGGRSPQNRKSTVSQSFLARLAIAGGDILGFSTADPVLAGVYNRRWGVNTDFYYNEIAPFSEQQGCYQFNHEHSTVFRQEDWVLVNRGFSEYMWGAEIFKSENRYGRYQSYGALELIYPGEVVDNGYDVNTWDWNYNPGATTIVLPWAQLEAEDERIDERQQNRFVGGLSFDNRNSRSLSKIHGNYGLFAMDFQEAEGRGFGENYAPEGHNATFRFKKSSFFFDDVIVCLGSNINNDDIDNPTVTTLYQRLNRTSGSTLADGQAANETHAFSISGDHWILNQYNTGFYIFSGSDVVTVKKSIQQTPYHYQKDLSGLSSNDIGTYGLGYLNHGTNPQDASYEYILVPNATSSAMASLAVNIQNGIKSYTVHQKNAQAHIVEHVEKRIFGYALFESNSNIAGPGLLKAIDFPSLVMYQKTSDDNIILTLTNPDVGYQSRSFVAANAQTVNLTIKGNWNVVSPVAGVQVVSSSDSETVLSFLTKDGLPMEVELTQMLTSLNTEENVDLTLFPNPTEGIVNIGRDSVFVNWELYNPSGVLLSSGFGHTIHLSGYPAGVYLVKISRGDIIMTETIIKN